jgi:hypothetical protein
MNPQNHDRDVTDPRMKKEHEFALICEFFEDFDSNRVVWTLVEARAMQSALRLTPR